MKEPQDNRQLRDGEYDVASAVRAILAGQSASGAFVASPDFSQYHYCWLRDGSFIAHALDLAGEVEAAWHFHLWCAEAVGAVRPLMERACTHMTEGTLAADLMLPPARYNLDGSLVGDDWPNFQVDGYGTWLWGLSQHLVATGDDLPAWLEPTVRCTANYLAVTGMAPCYDPWEENPTWLHTATLGCVWAGLAAAGAMLDDDILSDKAASVRTRVVEQARQDGYFRKADQCGELDAAVLWLCKPLSLISPRDAAFCTTAERVARELDLKGGTRRYATDTFYGGGAWPVLTASLGLFYAASGQVDRAKERLTWISAHVDGRGRLAEQYGGQQRDPLHYDQWTRRWGPPAADLLWSHAMYIMLDTSLSTGGQSVTPAADGQLQKASSLTGHPMHNTTSPQQ